MVGIEPDALSAQPSTNLLRYPDLLAVLERALPDYGNAPTRLDQGPPIAFVSSDVGLELGFPKLRACCRIRGVTAFGVSMPETAVYETNRSKTGKNEIRLAWKAFVVQPEPEPVCVKRAPQDHLGSCVLASNARHHARTGGLVYYIRHGQTRDVIPKSRFDVGSFLLYIMFVAKPVATVDLFSGPGGLGEGFSACVGPNGERRYQIDLSVEKDPTAHSTLLLRAFLRKFDNGFPAEYYAFLNEATPEPDWARLYPVQWQAAREETQCLELGRRKTTVLLERRIEGIRAEHGERTLLLGGPPCQVYSLVGRARNAKKDTDALNGDKRNFLYKEYARVLASLRPVAFIMENVKGMLSSTVRSRNIFESVLEALCSAAGPDSYRLLALSPSRNTSLFRRPVTADGFIVRAEDHGLPQVRHRVFIVGLRRDVAECVPVEHWPHLQEKTPAKAKDVLGKMPVLRCGLSGGDSSERWQQALRGACGLVSQNRPQLASEEEETFDEALSQVMEAASRPAPSREAPGHVRLPNSCPAELCDWIGDPKLKRLPNNYTRAHMSPDLARYLFSAAFGRACGRSPKARDFPDALAPNHKNWWSGKFDDRFRVQLANHPSGTITSHLSKDGHYYIHPDPTQCRSLTVREAARLQTFPDNYLFKGNRSEQYVQVGNAVPPFLAHLIADSLWDVFEHFDRMHAEETEREGQSEREPIAVGLV